MLVETAGQLLFAPVKDGSNAIFRVSLFYPTWAFEMPDHLWWPEALEMASLYESHCLGNFAVRAMNLYLIVGFHCPYSRTVEQQPRADHHPTLVTAR